LQSILEAIKSSDVSLLQSFPVQFEPPFSFFFFNLKKKENKF